MSKVRIQGINIAYDDEGSGEPVVLLHGYPFNRSMWRDQVRVLSQFHRVIVPDLRGHGESDVAPATIEAMAHDVKTLLNNLGISRAVVGGLSMGGYVALSFCRPFPQFVRSLLLADTRSSADTDEIRQNRAKQSERALREGMGGIAEELLPRLITQETIQNRPEIAEHVRQMIVQTKPEGAAAALEAMAKRQDQTAFLSRIVIPTLIIVGRQDTITPPTDSELMHREIAGSRLEVIEDAGHVSNLEQPEQFNRTLASFLRLSLCT